MRTDFIKYSYNSHSNTYNSKKKDKTELELYTNWFENNTVDVWRHLRYFNSIVPILKESPQDKWLTIADGRFGTAAMFLEKFNIDVLATDIDDSLLNIAIKENLIKKAQYENAEKLSFKNNSFDYSLCKEAFHHFPQPYLALYEMLRVSKKGIILSEPRDWIPSPILLRIAQKLKHFLYQIIGKKISHPDEGNYEQSGNYVYTTSEREIQKVALAQNFPTVAFKKIHDIYYNGVEKEMLDDNGKLFRKIKRKLLINSFLSSIKITDKNRLISIIFKEEIPIKLKDRLKFNGFEVIDLPRNPYVKS